VARGVTADAVGPPASRPRRCGPLARRGRLRGAMHKEAGEGQGCQHDDGRTVLRQATPSRASGALRGADEPGGLHVEHPGNVSGVPDTSGSSSARHAYRLIGLGVQDHQSGRARVPHQIGGRSHVTLLFHRRQRWPHHVRGGGRSRRCLKGLLYKGIYHDVLSKRFDHAVQRGATAPIGRATQPGPFGLTGAN
jgi:hypothetical protein